MASKKELLKQFIQDNLSNFQPSGDSGEGFSHPEFELYARDYIGFAEKEFELQDERKLINCVAHLKRAMDCQLDTFLHVFGLAKVFEKRNLKFEKKLDFLKEIGVFSSRTLARLNTIRNRMEHSYEIPKVQDLEVYFDLVVAFVSVLERSILFAGSNERDFDIVNEDNENLDVQNREHAYFYFIIKYELEKPAILAKWQQDKEETLLIAELDDIDEFAYFFRIFVLLHQREGFASDRYILSQL